METQGWGRRQARPLGGPLQRNTLKWESGGTYQSSSLWGLRQTHHRITDQCQLVDRCDPIKIVETRLDNLAAPNIFAGEPMKWKGSCGYAGIRLFIPASWLDNPTTPHRIKGNAYHLHAQQARNRRVLVRRPHRQVCRFGRYKCSARRIKQKPIVINN